MREGDLSQEASLMGTGFSKAEIWQVLKFLNLILYSIDQRNTAPDYSLLDLGKAVTGNSVHEQMKIVCQYFSGDGVVCLD